MGRFATLFQAVASLPSFNEAFRLLVSYEKLGSFSSSNVGCAESFLCFFSLYIIWCMSHTIYNMVYTTIEPEAEGFVETRERSERLKL